MLQLKHQTPFLVQNQSCLTSHNCKLSVVPLAVFPIFCNVIKIEGERHPRVTKYKTPF